MDLDLLDWGVQPAAFVAKVWLKYKTIEESTNKAHLAVGKKIDLICGN